MLAARAGGSCTHTLTHAANTASTPRPFSRLNIIAVAVAHLPAMRPRTQPLPSPPAARACLLLRVHASRPRAHFPRAGAAAAAVHSPGTSCITAAPRPKAHRRVIPARVCLAPPTPPAPVLVPARFAGWSSRTSQLWLCIQSPAKSENKKSDTQISAKSPLRLRLRYNHRAAAQLVASDVPKVRKAHADARQRDSRGLATQPAACRCGLRHGVAPVARAASARHRDSNSAEAKGRPGDMDKGAEAPGRADSAVVARERP